MNNICKILLSSVLIAGLSGCVSTRGLVTLESPKPISTQEVYTKTAVIRIVEDKRVFEDKPKQANIPSLKGGLQKATELDKAKAVARKRNSYGKAMGDILLKDETVADTVQKRVKSALLHSGYKVVSANEVKNPDVEIVVKVDKFWSWMQPGFSYVTVHSEIETEIISSNGTIKPINTTVKVSKPSAMLTGAKWIAMINETLDDYEKRLVEQLK